MALALSCSSGNAPAAKADLGDIPSRVFSVAGFQLPILGKGASETTAPRTIQDQDEVVYSDIGWWCSGFFPGSLWLTYRFSGDSTMRELADMHTRKLFALIGRNTDHDIGFQIMSSFGNGYRLTGDNTYTPTIRAAARKLASRYSETTGTIRSWDGDRWSYPVIIDNMMNLELLMAGARLIGGDEGMRIRQIAIQHAKTTLKNHFRDDWSTFHLVDYDPSDGHVLRKMTVQGYADSSSWARGQAWALYGYTMMTRELLFDQMAEEAQLFLEAASGIARMLLGKLPEDGIPYWDFDDPSIPEALRDASAGAIMASAFAELSSLTKDRALSKDCLEMSVKQVTALASPDYLAMPGTNGGFLLKHSVGNIPGGTAIDVPLSYADYYFLEAILRLTGK